MLKNNKGISLITAVVTVLVLAILLSTISYSSIKNVKLRKINKLYNDLRKVTDEVQLYYVKHAKLPITDEKYVVTESSVKKMVADNVSETFTSIKGAGLDFILKKRGNTLVKDNLYNPNDYDNSGEVDQVVYYKIDLSLFDNMTLDNAGTYLVNERSKTVYYYEGLQLDNKKYHKLPLTYIDIPYENN